ncbi:MAG: radical SAM protein, partial [Oscillospiraceae bacterium]|nr:radical SAM protein [Oscillospiraceae bacterium]
MKNSFTNEMISEELYETNNALQQAFPGQYVYHSNRATFPDPANVGQYIAKDAFLKVPKWPSSWIHWKDRCDKILQGKYSEIVPVHYEGIFTLLCNMLCSHCARKKDREKEKVWLSPGGDFEKVKFFLSGQNTMSLQDMRYVIDQLKSVMCDNQMGIVWGGGDPTMNPYVYDGMQYAREKGLTSSFITNGVFLDVDHLISCKPTLIRISLNCGTEKNYSSFHGINDEWKYFETVWRKIKKLNKLRVSKLLDSTLFGLSLIVDDRNILDFPLMINRIVDMVLKDGKGIDYIIIRPVMQYKHLSIDDFSKTKVYSNSISICDELDNLKKVGIIVVPIKDSFEQPPSQEYYRDKKECLAYGMCGEIRYNGDVQLCSDSYGNPDYTIGNLLESPLIDIFQSKQRSIVLGKINESNCFATRCPHNSRGHHLNRIFYQIEMFRKKNQMSIVKKWIDD